MMDKNLYTRNEKLAQKVIKGLASRNMSGYYAASKEEALEIGFKYVASAPLVRSSYLADRAVEACKKE